MNKRRETILIVDDNDEFRSALSEALESEFEILVAATPEQTNYQIAQGVDVVALDIRLNETDSANQDGMKLLKNIKEEQPNLPVVMMTNYADINVAIEAMRLGASDFVQKTQLHIPEFRKVIHKAVEESLLKRNYDQLKEENKRLAPWELIGDDPKIHKIRHLIDIVAKSNYSVLIRGETGTGKELVARAVHSRGSRADFPFVPVSLSALQPHVVESEIFGHAKGAFTDARESKIGFFENAQGGVLFLDEIGDLSPEIQIKLLRFLETRTINRVGSTQEIKLDLQIVAATNRNLEEAIKQGQFRDDLYYRLKTMEIYIPPLRERNKDIPLLADHFLYIKRQEGKTKLAGYNPEALNALENYRFPGNVRELKAVVDLAIMLADSQDHQIIEVDDLQLSSQRSEESSTFLPSAHFTEEGIDLAMELARTELSYVQRALEITNGKKTEAWKILGLNDRFALLRRIKKIGETYPHLVELFPLVQKLYYE